MRSADPGPAILSIGTAVPLHQVAQADVCTWVSDSLVASPAQRRWLNRLYTLSGIETRHSCLPDAAALAPHSRFAPGRPLAETPTTAERMAIYRRESVQLGAAAAERALASPQLPDAAADVTHLIVVSCTGFFAPGLDLAIARRLGLRPTVQRTLVGFMGCAAAFNGLRLAAQIVAGQPDAQVLVVCVALCTLHLQPGNDRIALTVVSLFADGAAACLVGVAGPSGDLLRLNRLHTQVLPDTTGAVAWQIGDHGFVMHLSPDVPRHVGTLAKSALATLLDGQPTPTFWAIHPGGRAIVDRLADLIQLAPAQMAASYSILRRYGNMSSPTILFVLRELLDQLRTADIPVSGVAAAFGPGLVTEMAHLTYVPPVAVRPRALRQPQRSCLAAAVAQRGWRVVLLERQRGPRHKVCGEFLSPEAQASLRALDLHATVAALAPAAIHRAAIISRQGQRLDMALPGVAWSVSRFRLDAALARAAAQAGATVREGITGTAITQHEDGYKVEMRDADAQRTIISARAAVVACGRHAVPGLRPPQVAGPRHRTYVGVKCHYAGLQLPPEVRIYLFKGGYVGLSPIEGGRANLCLLADAGAFARAGGRHRAMLDAVARASPALARDLAGGRILDASLVAVGAVDTERPTVLWDPCARIGDAVTMTPPLCGDGQAMAIHAAEICAPLIDDVLAGRRSLAAWQTSYAATWHAAYDRPLRTARWLQAILGQPQISAGLIGLGALLPSLAQRLVLATRGPQRA